MRMHDRSPVDTVPWVTSVALMPYEMAGERWVELFTFTGPSELLSIS